MRQFYIGPDLAKQRDHSAIAVVEKIPGSKHRVARAVKRIPLGKPYKELLDICGTW